MVAKEYLLSWSVLIGLFNEIIQFSLTILKDILVKGPSTLVSKLTHGPIINLTFVHLYFVNGHMS